MQIRILHSVLCLPYSVLTTAFCRPGGDLLSRVLRQSTIGAEAFDGRVRDGIGSYRLAEGHQAGKEQFSRRMTANGYGNSACADPISVVDIPIEAKLVFSLSDRLT